MTENKFDYIKQNTDKIRGIMEPYKKSRLMAVVKTRSNAEIEYAIKECGITLVGENRVQELLAHYDTLKACGAEIHLIGSLQKNKVKYIFDKVNMIESLDSESLAFEIDKRMAEIDKQMDVLIEINIGSEPQKGGVLPCNVDTFLKSFDKFKYINIRGFMTVAPKCETQAEYSDYFNRFKKIALDTWASSGKSSEPILSFGMSDNYETALKCGSGIIRIGSGIFGPRNYISQQNRH